MVGSRALLAPRLTDTNASFRTEGQSFLRAASDLIDLVGLAILKRAEVRSGSENAARGVSVVTRCVSKALTADTDDPGSRRNGRNAQISAIPGGDANGHNRPQMPSPKDSTLLRIEVRAAMLDAGARARCGA